MTAGRSRASAGASWTLVMSVAASSLSFIEGSVLNVALPAIRTGLDASAAEVQWVVNASPEPFSNIAVSTAEDVATGGLLALAIANPIAAALIAAILALTSLWLMLAARRALKRLLAPKRRPAG